MNLSEYLIESIGSKKTGKYRTRLVFSRDEVEDARAEVLKTLEQMGAKEFFCSKDANPTKILKLRTDKPGTDGLQFTRIAGGAIRDIMVLGPGAGEGRKAVLLMFWPDGPLKWANMYELSSGGQWVRTNFTEAPKEMEDEINSILG